MVKGLDGLLSESGFDSLGHPGMASGQICSHPQEKSHFTHGTSVHDVIRPGHQDDNARSLIS